MNYGPGFGEPPAVDEELPLLREIHKLRDNAHEDSDNVPDRIGEDEQLDD